MRVRNRLSAVHGWTILALVFTCLATAACDDLLAPADLAGTYVYAPPNGLVVAWPSDTGTGSFTMALHDTLTLRADGTGLVSGRGIWITPPPGEGLDRVRAWAFRFRVRSTDLVTSPLPDAPSCEACANWTFSVQGSSIMRTNDGRPPGTTIYRRVGPPRE
jgi:hypothetical protein